MLDAWPRPAVIKLSTKNANRPAEVVELRFHRDQWTACAEGVACPFCQSIGSIELFFHREARLKRYLPKLADLRSGGIRATAICIACRREVSRPQWPEALGALFDHHQHLHKGRADFFRVAMICAAFTLALLGWFAYEVLSPLYGSLASYGATPQRIAHAMRHMAPGMVFLIESPARQQLLGEAGKSHFAAGVYILVRVEAVEGDRVTLRLHKISWMEHPLAYGIEDRDGAVQEMAQPANFSADEIVVQRDEAHQGFVAPASRVPLTVRSVVVE